MAALMMALLLSAAASTVSVDEGGATFPAPEVSDEVSLLSISSKVARLLPKHPPDVMDRDPVEVISTGSTKDLSKCRELPRRCRDAKPGTVPQGCIRQNGNANADGRKTDSLYGASPETENDESIGFSTDLENTGAKSEAKVIKSGNLRNSSWGSETKGFSKAEHPQELKDLEKRSAKHSKKPSKLLLIAGVNDVFSKKYSVTHKEPSKVAVASQCGGSFYRCDTGAFTESFKNHRAYANKHGYEYFLLSSHLSSRFAPWDRFPLISHLHERGAEWVLFIEADSLIMNQSISVEDFLEQNGRGKDIIGSGDQGQHFTGNILVRKSKFSHSVMCKSWKVCPSPRFDQLGALMVVLAGGSPNNSGTWQPAFHKVRGCGITANQQTNEMKAMPNVTQKHTIFLPQQAMNSYDTPTEWKWWYISLPHAYAPGDWIVHFAGSPEKPQEVPQFAHMANVSNGELDSGTTSVDNILVDDGSDVHTLSSTFDCSDVNLSEPLL